MTELLPAIVLPDTIPSFPSWEYRDELEARTIDRFPKHRDPDALGRRARYLLRKLGGRLKGIEGSQSRVFGSYHVELTAHEYAHCLHYGLAGPQPLKRDLDDAISCRPKEENNENEMRTSASTMLVLEYLGLRYNPYDLVWSTYRNIRGIHFELLSVWQIVMELRQDAKVIEVARQIACHLLKLKYGQA